MAEGVGLSVSSTGSVLMKVFSILLLGSIFLIHCSRLTGINDMGDGAGGVGAEAGAGAGRILTGRRGWADDCVVFITGTLFMF